MKFVDKRAARLIVLLALFLCLAGCALLQQDLVAPEVKLVAIAPTRISFSGVSLRCTLRVDNPNAVSIPIQGASFDLDIEGMPLATSYLPDSFDVAPQSSEMVDVIVDINSVKGLALVLNTLQSGDQTVDYRLKGYIDVAISYLGRVRVDESGEVDLGRYLSPPR